MSLNTGIVTTLNFQREVVFSVSQITFAHELGHNLGSQVTKPHNPARFCHTHFIYSGFGYHV